MQTVWKYTITAPLGTPFYVEMPDEAMPVHVDVQGNSPMMWAQVDTEKNHTRRRFVLIGTGHPLPLPGIYIGTGFAEGETVVFHLFEVPEIQ